MYHRWCYVTIGCITAISFHHAEFWLIYFFQYREELRRLRSGTTTSSISDKGEKKSVRDDEEEVAPQSLSEEDEVRATMRFCPYELFKSSEKLILSIQFHVTSFLVFVILMPPRKRFMHASWNKRQLESHIQWLGTRQL